jgi:hypothetical protein
VAMVNGVDGFLIKDFIGLLASWEQVVRRSSMHKQNASGQSHEADSKQQEWPGPARSRPDYPAHAGARRCPLGHILCPMPQAVCHDLLVNIHKRPENLSLP